MTLEIGFMQGRLLEKYNGRYQAFHPDLWQDEFRIASEIGLTSIELIADYENEDVNPLFQDAKALSHLLSLSDDTGVKIRSICADYFMKYHLIDRSDGSLSRRSFEVMEKLVENGSYIGVENIVIPFVDESSIKNIFNTEKLVRSIQKVTDIFQGTSVEASFELDLPPKDVLSFVEALDRKNAKINYDIGNSAALGFSIKEELRTYGDLINDIHLKDRKFGAGPVIFGAGEADFGVLFDHIYTTNFTGPIVMQSYRDHDGLQVFKEQLQWITERYIRE